MVDVMTCVWRTGRHLDHTVYAQIGPDPSDDDVFLFTTNPDPTVAEHIVRVHNAGLEMARG